jgi:hypothetical protein
MLFKERKREAARKWNRDHPEQKREYNRKYYEMRSKQVI